MSDCYCCKCETPTSGPRVCPECGHVFQGKGWDGIDAHWRAKKHQHERVIFVSRRYYRQFIRGG